MTQTKIRTISPGSLGFTGHLCFSIEEWKFAQETTIIIWRMRHFLNELWCSAIHKKSPNRYLRKTRRLCVNFRKFHLILNFNTVTCFKRLRNPEIRSAFKTTPLPYSNPFQTLLIVMNSYSYAVHKYAIAHFSWCASIPLFPLEVQYIIMPCAAVWNPLCSETNHQLALSSSNPGRKWEGSERGTEEMRNNNDTVKTTSLMQFYTTIRNLCNRLTYTFPEMQTLQPP